MPKTADRHKSGFMIRLPESYRTLISALTDKSRRTITTEVQVALDKHAKDAKVPPARPAAV